MIDVPQGIPSQIIDLAKKNVEQANRLKDTVRESIADHARSETSANISYGCWGGRPPTASIGPE
jgi:ethanolamine ammonia-lyase small subunit